MASYRSGGYVWVRGVAGLLVGITLVLLINADANAHVEDKWHKGAHATFYGSYPDTTSNNMGGACGYGNRTREWYGDHTTAVNSALFDNGNSCGRCYEIKCQESKWCNPASESVTVTVTNFCPGGGEYGWCNSDLQHFDMSVAAWGKIGRDYKAGIIPVAYRRVRCERSDGVRFTITQSSPYFSLVLISNVGGAGGVKAVKIQTTQGWSDMTRNWGQLWQTGVSLTNQDLSFIITTEDGNSQTFMNAIPPTDKINQDFMTSRDKQFY